MSTTPPLTLEVQPGARPTGEISVPGDKSISHRGLILGALADGETRLSGFLESADCLATLSVLQALGVLCERPAAGEVIINGVGLGGLQPAPGILDCGNSGTAMRLLSGVLAGQPFTSSLTGDASLRRRPMQRIIQPLGRMGSRIESSKGGFPPLEIYGCQPLTAIDFSMPIASAQVKSAVLLAGLNARGRTVVREPAISRNHTELMLKHFHARCGREDHCAWVEGGGRLSGAEVSIPGDLSSAAFFMVAAAVTPGAHLLIRNVGVNPTRTGVITLLLRMGARIRLLHRRTVATEPVADIEVHGGKLRGTEIEPGMVSLAIDEFPVLLVAAACAGGRTCLRGAGELRHKESDRLAAMAEGLSRLGVRANILPDGICVEGGRIEGGSIDSHGDHRIAMAFLMAGSRAAAPIRVMDCANIATSFPDFLVTARQAGFTVAQVTG